MCGRFLFTAEQSKEIEEIIREVQEKVDMDKQIKLGEIYPTNVVPVLSGEVGGLSPQPVRWGFPKWDSKGVIINARADTVTDKKMFRDSVLHRRCVIPCNGFFEWDKSKQKYLFRSPESSVLYLAGFFNAFQGEDRFVILTTDANKSVEDIHHRMPLILEKQELLQWVQDTDTAMNILSRVPMQLEYQAV